MESLVEFTLKFLDSVYTIQNYRIVSNSNDNFFMLNRQCLLLILNNIFDGRSVLT